jgi:hypothetical protein
MNIWGRSRPTGGEGYAIHVPDSDYVVCVDGPLCGRWYTYDDWLVQRQSSVRLGVAIDRPDAVARCYLPTNRAAGRTDKPEGRDQYMQARVWEYVPPEQWIKWDKEYKTPEERT